MMVEDPWRRSSTGRSDTCSVWGSTTQTAGRSSAVVSAVAGSSMPPAARRRACPETVAPRRMASGQGSSPTLTWKLRVTGSACGATSRTRPVVRTAGSSVSAMLIGASREAWRIRLAGTSNTASAPSSCATRDDHLAGPHDLAGLGALGGDGARGIRHQLGVAELVLGGVQQGRGGIDLGLGAS